ncbi:26745_t:CDS:1, partial [Dentiscutata erythropus]
KVDVPEVPVLPKSKAEDISSSVTEELADNKSKLIESGPNEKATQVAVQPKISTTVTKLTSPIQSESKTQTSSWVSVTIKDSRWDT